MKEIGRRNINIQSLCLLVFLFLLKMSIVEAQIFHQKTWTFQAMGSAFAITAIHSDSIYIEKCLKQAKAEIFRIEQLISSWDAHSETSNINRNAGIEPVKVSAELIQLIQRSIRLSKLTNGAFDISYASMDKVWTFDGARIEEFDTAQIRQSVSKVNYQNIILNRSQSTVFLKEKGMKIGFGGIGKGYAADKAKALLLTLGIENGVVNAGGDLIAWGKKNNHTEWSVGIANPNQRKKIIGTLAMNNSAVVTSGDYEKFVIINGKRHAHIINPTTGFPTLGIKSVTIVCPIAEMADALATSIFVMGIEKGLSLVNQLKGVQCLIIDEDDKILTSNGLEFQKESND